MEGGVVDVVATKVSSGVEEVVVMGSKVIGKILVMEIPLHLIRCGERVMTN